MFIVYRKPGFKDFDVQYKWWSDLFWKSQKIFIQNLKNSPHTTWISRLKYVFLIFQKQIRSYKIYICYLQSVCHLIWCRSYMIKIILTEIFSFHRIILYNFIFSLFIEFYFTPFLTLPSQPLLPSPLKLQNFTTPNESLMSVCCVCAQIWHLFHIRDRKYTRIKLISVCLINDYSLIAYLHILFMNALNSLPFHSNMWNFLHILNNFVSH